MKAAVTYMRMSTDRQEHSIDSQERLIKSYANQNNFETLSYPSQNGQDQ